MSAAGAATFNSTVAATGFIIGSANIGEAELEILDGLAATTAELTIIDGNTSATSTTVADADRVVMNDNGTMVQVAVTDLAAYFDDEITAMPNLITTAATTVGALDSGSITSGFGTIDTGSSNITTTGVGAFGSLDISGDIDVDGTANLDIVDIDGAVDMATTLTVAGVASFPGHAQFVDSTGTGNNRARFGAGSDLQIWHDGSNSYISDGGTGDLIIEASDDLFLNSISGEKYIKCVDNAQVNLYYNNALKLATSTVGVTVTGTVIATTDTDTSNTGNVTLDFAANQNFVLTLTGNTTLVNPTTEQVGQSGFITLIQDGTGSRTLAVGDQYFGPGGDVPEISTGANSIDVIPYFVQAAGKILLGEAQKAFADAS
jgi:hypothetical protein